MLDLFESIRDRLGLSILFITHDLRVAARLCDTLAVMLNGRVVEHGPARDIFLKPQHAYTQALFAAAPGRGTRFGAERPTMESAEACVIPGSSEARSSEAATGRGA